MTPVPFVTLDREHRAVLPELRAAFDRVVDASSFILGQEVDAFETEFAAYCGVGECVGVASGTAALTLALMAAGVGPGDEVIVPGHTFIASALGAVHAGATPVFADVDPTTGLIDADTASAVITSRTAAIVAVQLYGQVCDMDELRRISTQHGLLLVEDAAQAHGAMYRGRRAGSLGDLACFSFYPSKNLGALGDGGAVCTGDPHLAARVRELRHLGQRGKGEHVVAGFNERLDGLQAAFLRVKLDRLEAATDARRAVAQRYDSLLESAVVTLAPVADSRCVYHLYPVRVPGRAQVVERLASARISTGIHYFPAAHRHPAFLGLPPASRPVPLLVSEMWADEALSLPMGPELAFDEVQRVSAELLLALSAGQEKG